MISKQLLNIQPIFHFELGNSGEVADIVSDQSESLGNGDGADK